MSIDAASYSALNKIFKLLDGSLDIADDIQIKSINATISWQDINSGSEIPVVLSELPEGSVLLHAQSYITTTFQSDSGVWYPQLSIGLAIQEFSELDYGTKLANGYELNATGFKSVLDMNGGLASATVDQVLNYKPNQLVAVFYTLGNWTTVNPMNIARSALAGAGTYLAALSFGGDNNGGYLATTEEYDGTSWTTSNDMNTARRALAGAGTQTAALSFGGGNGSSDFATTEEYDGTSWTTSNDLGVARRYPGGIGIQTAALCFGGGNGVAIGYIGDIPTEEYDGSSWTTSNILNVARWHMGGAGTQTVGLSFGGWNGGYLATTEKYDGTSWVLANDMNVARTTTGAGTQAAGLSFGGSNATGVATTTTEEYDGTDWVTSNNMNVARYGLAGAGTQAAALGFSGKNGTGSYITTTEEYVHNTTDLSELTQGDMNLYITFSYS